MGGKACRLLCRIWHYAWVEGPSLAERLVLGREWKRLAFYCQWKSSGTKHIISQNQIFDKLGGIRIMLIIVNTRDQIMPILLLLSYEYDHFSPGPRLEWTWCSIALCTVLLLVVFIIFILTAAPILLYVSCYKNNVHCAARPIRLAPQVINLCTTNPIIHLLLFEESLTGIAVQVRIILWLPLVKSSILILNTWVKECQLKWHPQMLLLLEWLRHQSERTKGAPPSSPNREGRYQSPAVEGIACGMRWGGKGTRTGTCRCVVTTPGPRLIQLNLHLSKGGTAPCLRTISWYDESLSPSKARINCCILPSSKSCCSLH